MISASLRLCADSSPARVPAVASHGSPGRSPCRQVDHTSASRSCRRNLELSSRAVPSEYDAFSNSRSDQRAVPSVPGSNNQAAMVGREPRSPRVAGVMCSPFRQLLTSSSPDIHTLHSVLIKLHRSEATTADLTHSGQSIGLLYSLASDATSANADSADMATAILASLATSPAARCQLPVHAREQLTDALISLVNKNTRAAPSSAAGTSQPHQAPDFPGHFPPPSTGEARLDDFSVHGILHSELPPGSPPSPSVQAPEADIASPAALAQAVAEKFARARDDRTGSTFPPAPVVTELADSGAFDSRPHWQREGRASSRDTASSDDHIPCPDPEEPAGESPTPAVFRKMSARTSAFLRASHSPPSSAAASAVSLATAATRVSGTHAPARAARRVATQVAPAPAPSVSPGVTASAGAASAAPPPAAAPPRPGHSLRDSESDAAAVTAVSLFLSKCGLVRSSLSRTMPLAGVLSAGGALSDGGASGQRAAEVEEEARRAGRRSAAALALGAAAAADEAMLRHFHGHNIPQVHLSSSPHLVACTRSQLRFHEVLHCMRAVGALHQTYAAVILACAPVRLVCTVARRDSLVCALRAARCA